MHTQDPAAPIDLLHDIDLKAGKFIDGTSAQDLKLAFDNFKANGPSSHLCVFFHGGLVSKTDGLNTAAQLIKGYTGADAYPFFSFGIPDLMTTIRALLQPHRDNPAFVKAANLAVKTVAEKIAGALDTGRSLKASVTAFNARKTSSMPLEELAAYAERFDRAWAGQRGGAQLAVSNSELDQFEKANASLEKINPAKRRMFSAKAFRGAQNPLARIIHRFNTGHDHGLYTTVIEELFIAARIDRWLGTRVWGKMKQFIDDSFAESADAGGTAFLNNLCDAWRDNAELRVTLIGHSAGAIYVQRFIEALDARLPASSPLKVEVITLAAAVSFQRMQAGLPTLSRRIAAIRAFGLDNKTESSYWEVPGIYNKSLLYIVSSLCEADPNADKPLLGMQRYWRGAAPYNTQDIVAVTNLIQSARCVWSPTKAGAKLGFQSRATHHGSFPEEALTNTSVCCILETGFSARLAAS